jgi:hypothetical protein
LQRVLQNFQKFSSIVMRFFARKKNYLRDSSNAMRSIELSKVSRGFRLTGELRFICKIICTCLCVSCQYFQEVTHTCTHTHIHDCHTHIHIHIHTHTHTIFIHHSYILHTTSMISCMYACASVKIACPNRARGHLECVVLISS